MLKKLVVWFSESGTAVVVRLRPLPPPTPSPRNPASLLLAPFPRWPWPVGKTATLKKKQKKPAARRANIDFERSERERIHFETATRVMNYEIQAERAEVMLSKNKKLTPAEARRLRRAALKNNYYGLIEVTVSGGLVFVT